jgi:para-nitrobenzyl esterase
MSAIKTDLYFRLPALRLADTVAQRGCPVWHYDFRWPSSLPGVGAAHSLELRFVFGTLDDDEAGLTHVGAPPSLATGMPAAWASMAADGRPNLHDRDGAGWRAFTDSRETLVLDEQIHHDAELAVSLRAIWGSPTAPACSPSAESSG